MKNMGKLRQISKHQIIFFSTKKEKVFFQVKLVVRYFAFFFSVSSLASFLLDIFFSSVRHKICWTVECLCDDDRGLYIANASHKTRIVFLNTILQLLGSLACLLFQWVNPAGQFWLCECIRGTRERLAWFAFTFRMMREEISRFFRRCAEAIFHNRTSIFFPRLALFFAILRR